MYVLIHLLFMPILHLFVRLDALFLFFCFHWARDIHAEQPTSRALAQLPSSSHGPGTFLSTRCGGAMKELLWFMGARTGDRHLDAKM